MSRPIDECAELRMEPLTEPGVFFFFLTRLVVTKPQRATCLCPAPQCWIFKSVQGHAQLFTLPLRSS